MVSRKTRIGFILTFTALFLFLAVSAAVFLGGSLRAKVFVCAAALLFFFLSLIYFQLKFYREGDAANIASSRKLPSTDLSALPRQLKSAHHRAIWESMEQSRSLMLHKEAEFNRVQNIREHRLLGLGQEEQILFIADRSQLDFWPVAPAILILLCTGAIPSGVFPASLSFACFIAGLLGLLLLNTARFRIRYYMTSFRILVRKKPPLTKTQWTTLSYSEISKLCRKKRFGRETLTILSGQKAISIQGLHGRKLQKVIEILHRKASLSQSSILEFYH